MRRIQSILISLFIFASVPAYADPPETAVPFVDAVNTVREQLMILKNQNHAQKLQISPIEINYETVLAKGASGKLEYFVLEAGANVEQVATHKFSFTVGLPDGENLVMDEGGEVGGGGIVATGSDTGDELTNGVNDPKYGGVWKRVMAGMALPPDSLAGYTEFPGAKGYDALATGEVVNDFYQSNPFPSVLAAQVSGFTNDRRQETMREVIAALESGNAVIVNVDGIPESVGKMIFIRNDNPRRGWIDAIRSDGIYAIDQRIEALERGLNIPAPE